MTDHTELIAEARKAAVAVYLATDAEVAADLSRILKSLADALEQETDVLAQPKPSRSPWTWPLVALSALLVIVLGGTLAALFL